MVELKKFCQSVDNDFKLLINKMCMVKITMEALQLNSSLAAQRKEDRRKKALVGDTGANDAELIADLT